MRDGLHWIFDDEDWCGMEHFLMSDGWGGSFDREGWVATDNLIMRVGVRWVI